MVELQRGRVCACSLRSWLVSACLGHFLAIGTNVINCAYDIFICYLLVHKLCQRPKGGGDLKNTDIVITKECGILYVDKTNAAKGEGLGQMLTWLTNGGEGVGQMPFLADKIFEQPLTG